MNPENKESQELARRMQIALQKAGEIIPSDLDVDEELPAESLKVAIPKSLSDVDAAMKRIFGDEEDGKIVDFPEHPYAAPFAMAARNGEVTLSEDSMNKLKRKKD